MRIMQGLSYSPINGQCVELKEKEYTKKDTPEEALSKYFEQVDWLKDSNPIPEPVVID